MLFTGKTYDFLKRLAQIYIPALGTLFFAVSGIWGIAHAEQIVGTLVAIDTFLGVCLGISQSNFDKSPLSGGTLVMKTNESGHKVYSLEIDADPTQLEQMSSVTFKVNKDGLVS